MKIRLKNLLFICLYRSLICNFFSKISYLLFYNFRNWLNCRGIKLCESINLKKIANYKEAICFIDKIIRKHSNDITIFTILKFLMASVTLFYEKLYICLSNNLRFIISINKFFKSNFYCQVYNINHYIYQKLFYLCPIH